MIVKTIESQYQVSVSVDVPSSAPLTRDHFIPCFAGVSRGGLTAFVSDTQLGRFVERALVVAHYLNHTGLRRASVTTLHTLLTLECSDMLRMVAINIAPKG